MCTLSYLPHKEGFYLVNNRDESPARAQTLQPQTITINGKKILCPIDTEGKGTWIGVNEDGRMVCLMNGAFVLHVKKPSYRMSRGKVTLELLAADDAETHFESMDLKDIEPFTVIIIERNLLMVFRWDEVKKYKEILSGDQAYNWSSSTLYNSEVAAVRAQYFNENVDKFNSQQELLLGWHKDQISGAPGVMLDLEMVKTVSITSINKEGDLLKMQYEDLLTGEILNNTLAVNTQLT